MKVCINDLVIFTNSFEGLMRFVMWRWPFSLFSLGNCFKKTGSIASAEKYRGLGIGVKNIDICTVFQAINASGQNDHTMVTHEQRTCMIGKMYEARKNSRGNHAERGEDGKYLRAQNGHLGERRVRQDEVIGNTNANKNESEQRADSKHGETAATQNGREHIWPNWISGYGFNNQMT